MYYPVPPPPPHPCPSKPVARRDIKSVGQVAPLPLSDNPPTRDVRRQNLHPIHMPHQTDFAFTWAVPLHRPDAWA